MLRVNNLLVALSVFDFCTSKTIDNKIANTIKLLNFFFTYQRVLFWIDESLNFEKSIKEALKISMYCLSGKCRVPIPAAHTTRLCYRARTP